MSGWLLVSCCCVIRAAVDSQDLCASRAASDGGTGLTDAALQQEVDCLDQEATAFFAGSLCGSVSCQLFKGAMGRFNLSLDIELIALNRSRMISF